MRSFKEEITGWGKEGGDGDYARTVQSGTVWDVPLDWCRKMIAGYKKWIERGNTPEDFEKGIDMMMRSYQKTTFDSSLIYSLTHNTYNRMYSSGSKPSKHWVFDDEVCAMDVREGNTSNCYGDSGGPLTYENPKLHTFTLMGVTSSSIVGDCEPKLPVMYSNLKYYANWIKHMHACIMLDRMKEWRKERSRFRWLAQMLLQKWQNRANVWYNRGRGSKAMQWRANRNRYSEKGFRDWYLDYMRPYEGVMQRWCNARESLERMFTRMSSDGWGSAYRGTYQELNYANNAFGFFPSMVEFTEWVGQGREEKYRRAWAKANVFASQNTRLMLPSHFTAKRIRIEYNIAVSMDLTISIPSSLSLQLFDIGNGLLQLHLYKNLLAVWTGAKWLCQGVSIGKLGTQHHLEVVLKYLYRESNVFLDGQNIDKCHFANTNWNYGRVFPIGTMMVSVGKHNNGYSGSYGSMELKNVEVRSWEDPPSCCSDWKDNKEDWKCIKGC